MKILKEFCLLWLIIINSVHLLPTVSEESEIVGRAMALVILVYSIISIYDIGVILTQKSRKDTDNIQNTNNFIKEKKTND